MLLLSQSHLLSVWVQTELFFVQIEGKDADTVTGDHNHQYKYFFFNISPAHLPVNLYFRPSLPKTCNSWPHMHTHTTNNMHDSEKDYSSSLVYKLMTYPFPKTFTLTQHSMCVFTGYL